MVGLQEPRVKVAESEEDEESKPEEVTLQSGREEAEGRRKAEQASRKRVAAEAKQKRRKWSEKTKDDRPQLPVESTSPQADSSSLLQEDVVQYLADREKSRAAAEEAAEGDKPAEVIERKRRKPSKTLDDRVRVVILDETLGKGPQAQSAQDFRRDRLFGSHVRRSAQMLSKTAKTG